MATVTPVRSGRSLVEDNRRVRHPLERLRGYIRGYVSLEGLAVVGLYLALWFWIGLFLDYGFFKLFGVDWVQVLPWGMRLGTLIVLLAGLLAAFAVKVLTRLFREFSDAALALVLEKRFPKELGDRLITAVELSDTDKAAVYGYSRAMVQETIHEAADRVGKLPIGQVFDWKRLVRRGVLVGVLTVVAYFVAVGVYGAVAYLREGRGPGSGFSRFHDVAAIWFERNILLDNTIWPRDAHLVVVQPERDPLRIGRDAPAPNIRVRALHYVVADRTAPEGWRALTWQDLCDKPALAASDTSPAPPPLDWKPRDESAKLTVDEVELQLGKFDIREKDKDHEAAGAKWIIASAVAKGGWRPLLWSDLSTRKLGGLPVPRLGPSWDPRSWPVAGGMGLVSASPGHGSLLAASYLAVGPVGLTVDEIEAQAKKTGFGAPEVDAVFHRLERLATVQTVLDRVKKVATDPGMSRTLRQLAIPDKVNLVYRGLTTTTQKSLDRLPDDEVTGNEFTGPFTNLKAETYSYYVWAADYASASRGITVLPPPGLVSLVCEQQRPAYLYYRPAAGSNGAELRGQKQVFEEIDMSSFGGDVSRIEVPAGTDVLLIAQANKDLGSVHVKPFKEGDRLDVKPLPDGNGDNPVHWQGETFRAWFPNVRREQNCVFVFTDVDNVVGSRQVVIKPKDDQPPDLIDVMPDAVVRKTKDGYIVSTRARVPFAGRIIDDNGLSGVRYAYTLAKIDSGVKVNVGALLMFATAPGLAGARGNAVLASACYLASQQEALRPGEQEAAPQKVVHLPTLAAFEKAVKDHVCQDKRPEVLPLQTVKELLARKQKLPYRNLLRDLTLTPDTWSQAESDPLNCDFAVWPLRLTAVGDREIQPRYKMQLWLEAVDTDLDSEAERDGTPRPHVSPSKDKFTFLIVSEPELLTEIAKEEEELRVKLEEMFNLLLESEAKLIRETVDLASAATKPENLGPMSARLEGLDQVLDKQQQKTKEVFTDYKRILEELRINRVDQKIFNQVNKTIVSPLGEIADFEFARTHDTLVNFRKSLEEGRNMDNAAAFPGGLSAARTAGAQAREQVRVLKDAVFKVLESMQKLTDINKLIKMLRTIEDQEQSQYDLIKRIKDKIEEDLIKGALDLPEPKKP